MADNNQYDSLIRKYADQYNVPFDLAKNLMMVESSGNANAVSKTGPVGLFQLSKATAIDAGINPNQRTDPETNIKAGISTLSQRYKDSGGDWGVALGMYNQGKAGFNKQMKSGSYKDEVVNYVNNPAFSNYVNDSRVKGIANPITNLNQGKEQNKYTPDLLSRGALNQAPTQADISASNASMQPTADVKTQTPINSLLQNQTQYQQAQEQQRLNDLDTEKQRKQRGYQQLGYMVLGAILGRNANQVKTSQEFQRVNAGSLQGYGNENLSNFKISSKG
jgi:hypothetical protein